MAAPAGRRPCGSAWQEVRLRCLFQNWSHLTRSSGGEGPKINERGISIFLVEQNVRQTLAISDYGYVLSKGRVVMEGKPGELGKTKEVQQAYFG